MRRVYYAQAHHEQISFCVTAKKTFWSSKEKPLIMFYVKNRNYSGDTLTSIGESGYLSFQVLISPLPRLNLNHPTAESPPPSYFIYFLNMGSHFKLPALARCGSGPADDRRHRQTA
ncbi:hypothetical protein EVAR_6164_1 [Eumeta japonica]|uniref:Uncharacterized protein n=1 Tax=Eumeta variegata TaxID=151549 RepID=A0A4C1TE88_EUMVA|nr:hypothetical protein EVAR_6164_1 [Eumeta japonica]